VRQSFFLLLPLIFINPDLKSQESLIHYHFQASGGYTSDHVPFWMRSNQSGSIPLDNASLGLTASLHKDYRPSGRKVIDWGAGIDLRGNIGNNSNLILVEGYGKIRLGIFEIKGGRSRETMGLCDSSLSTGAFSEAGNALGIPKVEISIPEFYTLPFLGHLFAFKGNYAHGWIGAIPVNMLGNEQNQNLETYLHQKSLYGRLGKPEWKLKLYGGFNHQVFWGSEKIYFGSKHILTPFETYMYVVLGKPYGTDSIPKSKIGNQLGSIDVGFDLAFRKVKLFAYHQFIYDIGALYHMANLRDGLTGLTLTHLQHNSQFFSWNKMLIEVFYTKNQAGELWSPYTPSGDENYYNNDQYITGWSYNSLGIGNPFIGTRKDILKTLPADPRDYFINNRVIAFHFGFAGSVQNWDFFLKSSYSLNYGTYGTSEEGHTLGKIRTLPQYGLFGEKKQFSAIIQASRKIKKELYFGVAGAFDVGELYYDTYGVIVSLGIEI
jgi:hypothetical protein